MARQDDVRNLVDRAAAAYDAQVRDPAGRGSVARIFEALDAPLTVTDAPPKRLEPCRYLDEVAVPEAMPEGSLRDLVVAFRDMEPHLRWHKRTGDETNANAAYREGHANAMIVGPGGLAKHDRVRLGVSLLAPDVRYPDHTHPPEETYLVLSEGEFFQEGAGWFTPGMGGTFYNPPGILHAMRSGHTPLFAMWALWAER